MTAITITGDNIAVSGAPVVSLTVPASLSPPGKLSLLSGATIGECDIAGAMMIFYVPSIGNSVAVFDGAEFEYLQISGQLCLPLDPTTSDVGYHQSGKTYDVFAINKGGTPQIVTGPPWSSDFVRGSGTGTTELEFFAGLRVNKNALANARFGTDTGNVVSVPARQATYLGSFTATGNGLATNSKAKRLLFNAYNQTILPMAYYDPAPTWDYASSVIRQANGNSANQLEFLLGLAGVFVEATATALAVNLTPGSATINAYIGLDSTTARATDSTVGYASLAVTGAAFSTMATYRGFPGIGRHVLTRLESAAGVAGTKWCGDSGTVTPPYRTGIYGSLLA